MKILLASPIDPDAIQVLYQQHDVENIIKAPEEKIFSLLPECEVLVFRSGIQISAEFMEKAPNLKLLVRAGSGVDNIDLPYVQQRGLTLVRIPEPGAQAVAEMSFAFMLSLSRNLFKADRSMREGRWMKYQIEGYLLKKKTLGIIGMGNIGSRVAEMGAAWGMNVIGCIEHPTQERALQFGQQGIQLLSFDAVVSQADYLSIHVPLKDSTRNLINAEVLSAMKEGSYLVNLARGGIVNEPALLEELAHGARLRGAALDVHKEEGEGKFSPLVDLPNVILTPHMGAMAIDAQREIGERVIEIIDTFQSEQRTFQSNGRSIPTTQQTVKFSREVGND